tara:strand:+ start:611 stop:1549 length:939 start_codon:yes stop_codon:yes gene_type:complete
MDPINDIPNINVAPNGTGIKFIQPIGNPSRRIRIIQNPNIREVSDIRIWVNQPPQALPIEVPVTTLIGTPVVDMPGCVVINKENAKNPTNKNKQLVNDDPKQNVVLCDGGMPYYEPPNYDARELTWQTVYMDQEEEAEGINTDPGNIGTPDTPQPPTTPSTDKDPDCPGPLAPRIGDLAASGNEKVVGFELQDNPQGGAKICITLYEDISAVEKFLPSVNVVTTTATIAAVATTSALLAKPLADLLLKVVKPAVKKVLTKVQTMMGKTPVKPTRQEIIADRYREKRGLLPLKKGPKKKLKKVEPKKKKFLLF